MEFINYKSDFELIISAIDSKGSPINLEKFDWRAKFSTSRGSRNFIADHRGKASNNAFIDNGNAHIIFDNHNLGVGQLLLELTVLVKDNNFPDGSRRVVCPVALDVELSHFNGNSNFSVAKKINLPINLDDVPSCPSDEEDDNGFGEWEDVI